MKIGYTIPLDYSGIAVYARHLILEMATYPDLEIHLYTSFRRKRQLAQAFEDTKRFHYRNVLPHDLMLGKHLARLTKLIQDSIWLAESFKMDIIHHTNPLAVPKWMRNTVVTVHDIFPLYMKVLPGVRETLEQKQKEIFEDSELIFVPSHFVRADIEKRLGIAKEKLRVTHLCASPHFKTIEPDWSLLKKYELSPQTPFLLHVSRIDYRKNLERMVEAYFALPKTLKQRVEFLVVTSGDKTELERAIEQGKARGEGGTVKVISHVPLTELVNLYNAALGFMFVSLAEGFGIPLLEAMQCGCPVITSTETSLPEIAGDAALLVKPYDTDAIAQAMRQVIESSELRAELRQKGLKRARQFSCKKMAEETLSGYQQVLSK